VSSILNYRKHQTFNTKDYLYDLLKYIKTMMNKNKVLISTAIKIINYLFCSSIFIRYFENTLGFASKRMI